MKLTRLHKEWHKASIALPLTVTILLALAIAGVSVFHIVTYRMPGVATPDEVNAFDFKERYDYALHTALDIRPDNDEDIAELTALAQSFDLEAIKLFASPFHALLIENGYEHELSVVKTLTKRIDAYVTGDPTITPMILAEDLQNAYPSISRLSRGLKDVREQQEREMRQQLSYESALIVVLVSLFMLSLAVLVPVEWHRRKNLLAKTRALEISEGKLRDLSFYRQQFLANMSHEFRTPLNAIQGFSEAILIQKDTMKQERIFEYVDIVSRSARDLAKLTEDVLDLSKIDAGKFDIQREDTSFTQLLEDAIVQFQSVAKQRDIVIRTGIEADWTVNCDRLAVKRCITNVLSNAVKFSEKGGAIYVDAYIRDRRLLVIEIRDVGCGIPERDLQSIWMVYARSSLTRKSDREGAGLGLAMVKALMDAHNGFVELQSREGVGTSVRMCFPLSMVVATHWRTLNTLSKPSKDQSKLKAG